MQACGLVNDHLVDCHRHEAVKHAARKAAAAAAPGSACCRAAGSTCSIPRRSISRSRTSRMAWPAWRAGTGRPRATMPSRWPSIACWWRRLRVQLDPGLGQRARLAALLHDAPEYVIGDMISPFKAALGYDYKAFEHRLMAAIHIRFGLPAAVASELETFIKKAEHAPPIWRRRSSPASVSVNGEILRPPARARWREARRILPAETACAQRRSALYVKTFRKLAVTP